MKAARASLMETAEKHAILGFRERKSQALTAIKSILSAFITDMETLSRSRTENATACLTTMEIPAARYTAKLN